ncbi:MAG: hypothetical protein M3380_19100 [Chloroflexota bacterium]|nr:hypothetical protein [Chloroflexota bacterium]
MVDLSRRGFLGSVAAAAAVTYLPTRAEAALPWCSGAFEDAPDTFAAWCGRNLGMLLWYTPKGTWSDIANNTASNLDWFIYSRYGSARSEIIVNSYPLFPNVQNPRQHGMGLWTRAADGEFDSYHRTAASKLKANTRIAGIASRLVFRIAWEWNNGSQNWQCTSLAYASAYRTYYRRVAQIIKAALPGVRIDWSCDRTGRAEGSLDSYYPGSDVVDFIGLNGYDFWPAFTDQGVWEREYLRTRNNGTFPAGFGSWLNYAKSKGKLLSIGEWGLIQKDRNGGGDNPLFIRKMLEFCRTNAANIAYESYFNKDTSSLLHRLDTTYPNASAEYRRQMAL